MCSLTYILTYLLRLRKLFSTVSITLTTPVCTLNLSAVLTDAFQRVSENGTLQIIRPQPRRQLTFRVDAHAVVTAAIYRKDIIQ